MNILFVSGAYKPARFAGGPGTTVPALAEAIVALGHRVTVVTLAEDAGEPIEVVRRRPVDVDGVTVIYFDVRHSQSGSDWSLRLRGELRPWEHCFSKWIADNVRRFDVVHVQSGFMSVAPEVSKRVKECGASFCYHQRGNLDPRRFGKNRYFKRGYIIFFERRVLSRADVLWALSAREEKVYRRWLPNHPKIERLPNGVDVSKWQSKQPLPDRIARILALAAGRPILLWFARWDHRKGPLIYLRMVDDLKRKNASFYAVMAGPKNGDALKTVRDSVSGFCKNHPLAVFTEITDSERSALLQHAEIFVLPTQGEGFSVGLLEAMACECCVVTTKEANFPELVTRHAGVECHNDFNCLSEQVEKLLAEPLRRKELARNGRLMVENEYTWESIAKRYIEVMDSVAYRNRST